MRLVPTVLDRMEEFVAGSLANSNYPLQVGLTYRLDSFDMIIYQVFYCRKNSLTAFIHYQDQKVLKYQTKLICLDINIDSVTSRKKSVSGWL